MGGLGRQGPGRRGALVTWPRQRQETPIRPRAAQAFRLAPHPSRRIRRAASVAPHGRHRRRVAPGGTWTGATRGGSTRPRSSPCTMHMTCPPRPPLNPASVNIAVRPYGHGTICEYRRLVAGAYSHASGGVAASGDALTRIAASDGKQTNCKHLYSYINSGEPSRASRPATPRSRSKPRTASRPAGPRRMRVCEQRVPDAGSAQRVCGLRDPERARRGTLRARRVSEAVAARRVAAPIVCTGAAKGGGDMARGAAGRDRSSRP